MSLIDLNGEWQLSSPQHPHISVPMTLPGDNHSALLAAGLIEDPYYGTNEKNVQWVGESEWQISRSFMVDEQALSASALDLKLGRVDTVARVLINGQEVLACSNMFRLYRVDIKPFVKLGENQIEVRFARADVEAKARAERLPFPIPSSMGSNNQIPHMNLLRKTQCHAGWDWGICLMVSGIYDAIELVPVRECRLERVSTEQFWQRDGSVVVKVSVQHDPIAGQPIELSLGELKQQISSDANSSSCASFHIEQPELWWPAGYGEQPLYPLTVCLDGQQISKRIGLRKLVLNDAEDSIGSAMEFQLNDFPITAKGANWIPIDARPSNETEARYRQLLQAAVDANMNMIRVWGGGQYESDLFYQLCDELGLMVWQDMMFACSLYPSTDEFIADVVPELRDQIRRLRDYSCIALWCGDNEVIGALNWYPESKADKVKYTVNYDRLNRVVGQTIREEDPSRRFWASSPCNGDLDYGDAWHEDNRGDMHFWDVWHSGASFKDYLKIQPRFCSEFGYQSWPSLAEVKRFVPESDWNVTSPTFESHQKNASGNSIITEMFTRYFRFPASFEQMLYLSQVQQAIAIKTACEYWRSESPTCRGMLYWQLNDNWPVSSWSSIEYSGRWKQLHYHAKRFFAPQYIPFQETEDAITLRLSNNSRNAHALKGRVYWMSWQGEVLGQWDWQAQAEADANQVVWSLDKGQWQSHADTGFFFAELFDADGGAAALQNTWFPIPELKGVAIEKANISVGIKGDSIVLSSDKPAFFVHLEHDGDGRFSDSSFTLLPGQPKTVRYLGDDLASLQQSLRVYDLSHSY
ncbi:beta-mannosidase [Aliagarivorans marinus]|uniref:beta-mannosidase n=1 Tax=Aliagarivorans marinus TaxID=561965 RepID=UPI00042112A2|nr:glycoside hydrolase family 2 protein [Aliagarivorans marinus]